MNADGSGQTQLTSGAANEEFPGWSPDGTKIGYKGGSSAADSGIWVMNAGGSGQTNLTQDNGTEP